MKKRKTKQKKAIIIAAILLLAGIVGGTLTYWYYVKNNPNVNNMSQQSTTASTEIQNTTSESEDTPTPTNSATQTTAVAPPAPTFTKSSGNNGSIPSNVPVNFVCNSIPQTTCQIILVSGDRTIELPTQTVKNNGRGQVFASWDWQSMSGVWQVLARAKNSQGGTADSANQTLKVQ